MSIYSRLADAVVVVHFAYVGFVVFGLLLVLLGMLPAVVEGDLETFGLALGDFNARVGELFAPAQGGIHASAAVSEVVDFIRAQGVPGVGQSSWGPGVFAVTEEERAGPLAEQLRERYPETEVLVTRPRNRGAEVSADSM